MMNLIYYMLGIAYEIKVLSNTKEYPIKLKMENSEWKIKQKWRSLL